MYYLNAFLFNFFIVFFVSHILPGIDIVNQTKLPHIGGDFIFAICLGFINSLIYPLLKVFNQVSILKIAGLSLVINFVSYAILKLLPIGIHVTSFIGYFSAAILVSFGVFLTNLLEMKHRKHPPGPHQTPGTGDFQSMP
jgi:uncharacterized membrane protein YvlD (DUF360 family)